jgi:hypothetical protein
MAYLSQVRFFSVPPFFSCHTELLQISSPLKTLLEKHRMSRSHPIQDALQICKVGRELNKQKTRTRML